VFISLEFVFWFLTEHSLVFDFAWILFNEAGFVKAFTPMGVTASSSLLNLRLTLASVLDEIIEIE